MSFRQWLAELLIGSDERIHYQNLKKEIEKNNYKPPLHVNLFVQFVKENRHSNWHVKNTNLFTSNDNYFKFTLRNVCFAIVGSSKKFIYLDLANETRKCAFTDLDNEYLQNNIGEIVQDILDSNLKAYFQ